MGDDDGGVRGGGRDTGGGDRGGRRRGGRANQVSSGIEAEVPTAIANLFHG